MGSLSTLRPHRFPHYGREWIFPPLTLSLSFAVLSGLVIVTFTWFEVSNYPIEPETIDNHRYFAKCDYNHCSNTLYSVQALFSHRNPTQIFICWLLLTFSQGTHIVIYLTIRKRVMSTIMKVRCTLYKIMLSFKSRCEMSSGNSHHPKCLQNAFQRCPPTKYFHSNG